jgi:hypothetical protein
MNPLPDRVVIVGLVATLGLVFALVFWFVKLHPANDLPLQWREGQTSQRGAWQPEPLFPPAAT